MTSAGLGRLRLLAKRFMDARRAAGHCPNTLTDDKQGLSYFLAFMEGRDEEDVARITPETLHAYQMRLYGEPGKRGKPLAMRTQSSRLTAVRMFFRWLVRRGHILGDPAAALVLPKIQQGLPRGVMTRREMEKLLAAPDVETPGGLRDRAILELMYSTGLRRGEVANLDLFDVDTDLGEVMVKNGKGGKDRVVPLGEVAGKYVNLYVKGARPKLLNGHKSINNLFVGVLGGRLWAEVINDKIVQRYAKMAGIKTHVTAHSMRHTCATHMLKGRANIRHIQALLGHGRLDTTQIYTRVEVGDLKREHRRCHPREAVR